MKISLKWLNDFVDVADYLQKPQELAQLLTDAGLEVEAVENPGASLQHVVVGQIQKLDRHPNADRLTVCQVDIGTGALQQIVCGAKNHKAGDKVVVTLPGAVLPGNFEIKKSKIRDVESNGMLASESELGLKMESEGILIMPPDAPVGKSFVEYFGLDDVLFEINVTPNRADCLSHLGLARELSAILNRKLKLPQADFHTDSALSTKKTVKLQVKDKQLCPRYTGRVLTGIKVGPSPDVLRRRLESIGMNSINNVVDITNYVMMTLGQPLHAFDLDHLQGATVEVARAPQGEVFTSLDGTEYKLSGDELVIRDGQRSVCLAGVVGGKNSGVSEKTTRVFLESAQFAMDSVRKTSRRLGLQTDSAYRFSRGTDPSGVLRASDLACSLLQRYAGATVAADFYDEYPSPVKKQPIAITLKDVTTRLGFAATAAEFSDWMRRLGCEVKSSDSETFLVTPPEFRDDLEMKEDLIEEYGRLQGYDRIPEILPSVGAAPLPHAEEYVFDSRLARILEEEGYSQAIHYAFTSSKVQSEFLGPADGWAGTGLPLAEAVSIRNPLNEDVNVMRVSLATDLYRTFVYNSRHGMTEGRLFENGFVFQKAKDGYAQSPRLAMMAWGQPAGLWQKSSHSTFFDVKSALENILQRLRVGGPKGLLKTVFFQSLEFRALERVPAFLNPGRAAAIFCEGNVIGYVGSVHPRLLSSEKISVEATIAELDIAPLRLRQPRAVKFQSISKLPSAERDFAFVVPKTVTSAAISSEIRKIAGPILQSLEIFDVFEGGSLPEGHRSVAYRLVFQDSENTLSETQLQTVHANIMKGLAEKLKIQIR